MTEDKPLVIHVTDVKIEVEHLEMCPDCASTPLIIVTGDDWDMVVGHSVPCPVMVAQERVAAT